MAQHVTHRGDALTRSEKGASARAYGVETRYRSRMHAVRGRVRNGRILVDEPTDLPEGTEIELVPIEDDELTEEERVTLDAVLLDALRNVEAGRTIDAKVVLDELGVER